MSNDKRILVFCEANEDGSLKTISLEALGLARNISDAMGCEVEATSPKSCASEVAAHGAVRVFSAEAPSGKGYRPEWHVAFMAGVIENSNPQNIIFGHTPLGQDIAARTAARLGVGLVSDSVGLKVVDGRLTALKPIQGGIGIAAYSLESAPRIVTVRPKVGTVPDKVNISGEVIEIDLKNDSDTVRWELIESVCEQCDEIRLDDAAIVVSGGRGMGGPEGFKMVAELANILGGAVGSSRPPCDMGWIPSSHQVGITGTVISPQVYLAIAISGASQHLSGMCDSKNIIAINKDAGADIFKVANHGVIGDFKQVLPAMIDEIKKIRGIEK